MCIRDRYRQVSAVKTWNAHNGQGTGGEKVKLLSVAIPCYNSERYMEHCIQTLDVYKRQGGDDGDQGEPV